MNPATALVFASLCMPALRTEVIYWQIERMVPVGPVLKQASMFQFPMRMVEVSYFYQKIGSTKAYHGTFLAFPTNVQKILLEKFGQPECVPVG